MSRHDNPVTLSGQASGNSRLYQAGRDLYVGTGNNLAPPTVIPITDSSTIRGHLVGRSAEIEAISAALQSKPGSSEGSVLVLSGLGGIGKTVLAGHASRLAVRRGAFPGGAITIDFRGYEAESNLCVYPQQVYSPALKALGVDEIDPAPENHGPQFHSELNRRAAKNNPTLLLLDNVRDPEQVLPLLPISNLHRVLVTSRNALAPLLPGATNLRLDVLPQEDATKLIKLKANREINSADLDELATLCDRLPLALSIVGSILASDPQLSARDLACELSQEEERLEGLEHEDVAVRAAFHRSYARLRDFDAQAFRALSLNPSSDISTEAAALLIDVSKLKARRALRHLLNCHLVESGNSSDRWTMHDLVRLYATEQAEQVDREEIRHEARMRLFEYYVSQSSNAAEWINGQPEESDYEGFSSRDSAMEWFAAEAANLIASVRISDSLGEHDVTTSLATSLVGYLDNVADYSSAISILFSGIEAGKRSRNDLSIGAAYNNLGITYTSMRKYRDAVRWLNKAVALFRSLGEPDEEARSLINLSGALRMMLGFEASIEPLRRAMEIRGSESPGAGFAFTNLGIGLREAGRLQEAKPALLKALEIHSRSGARNAQASTLTQLGTTMLQIAQKKNSSRDLAEGIRYLQEGIIAYRDVRDRTGEGAALLNYGNAILLTSEKEKALEAYRSALQVFQDIGDGHGQGLAEGAIGLMMAQHGDAVGAQPHLTKSLQLLAPFHEPEKKMLMAKYLRSGN
ncbi:tetratricopeptide repeat protein [Streptomyces sp. NPDC047000]|uniref:tetratricopeptide repeat protein n=1 Tax=Streptomyces sp. NPDC047000 TaxID=3155474 RepID=UPI0033C6B151